MIEVWFFWTIPLTNEHILYEYFVLRSIGHAAKGIMYKYRNLKTTPAIQDRSLFFCDDSSDQWASILWISDKYYVRMLVSRATKDVQYWFYFYFYSFFYRLCIFRISFLQFLLLLMDGVILVLTHNPWRIFWQKLFFSLISFLIILQVKDFLP